ncbi:MAG: hypothetical protein HZC18_01085 [Candidatus Omnitrophica bacterium]|nr:hypothetical protein [Candidatus Omnitrophota bacterium]
MRRRQRQTIIAIIAGAIGLVLILAVGWFFVKPYWSLGYENAQYGFALKYPAAWSFAENQRGAAAIFYSPKENALDIFRENVNIVVRDISQKPMTLEKYTETAIGQMNAVFGTNLEILGSTRISIDHRPAHQFIFIGKGPDGNFQYQCRWTLAGTTAYQITYTAISSGYERHLAEAERIMNSFRIR